MNLFRTTLRGQGVRSLKVVSREKSQRDRVNPHLPLLNYFRRLSVVSVGRHQAASEVTWKMIPLCFRPENIAINRAHNAFTQAKLVVM